MARPGRFTQRALRDDASRGRDERQTSRSASKPQPLRPQTRPRALTPTFGSVYLDSSKMMRGDLEMSDVRLTDAEAHDDSDGASPGTRDISTLSPSPCPTRAHSPVPALISPHPSPVHLQAARFARLSALAPTVSPPRPRVARPVPRRRVPRGALPRRVRHHQPRPPRAPRHRLRRRHRPQPRPPPRRRHIPVLRRPGARLHVSRRRRRGRTQVQRDWRGGVTRRRPRSGRRRRRRALPGRPPPALQRHRRRRLRGRSPRERHVRGDRIPRGGARRGDAEHVRGLSRRVARGRPRRRGALGDSRFTPGVGATRHAPVVASRASRGDARGGFHRGSRTRARHRAKRGGARSSRDVGGDVSSLGPSLPPSRRRHVRQPRARANASRHRDRRCRRASNGSPRGGVGARRARGWRCDDGG